MSVPGTSAEEKFLVDLNVARLGKWLRALGFDTLFLPQASDDEIIQVAIQSRRVLLTRDTHILRRRVVATGQLRALLVVGDDVREQVRYVLRRLGVSTAPTRRGMFSLCIECNLPLEGMAKEQVRGLVPPYVFETQSAFMQCPGCRKIYWQGTHWANMRLELTRVQEGGPP